MSDKTLNAEKKIIASVLVIVLGIHKFILGYTKQGILYLAKDDETFAPTYVDEKRAGSKIFPDSTFKPFRQGKALYRFS